MQRHDVHRPCVHFVRTVVEPVEKRDPLGVWVWGMRIVERKHVSVCQSRIWIFLKARGPFFVECVPLGKSRQEAAEGGLGHLLDAQHALQEAVFVEERGQCIDGRTAVNEPNDVEERQNPGGDATDFEDPRLGQEQRKVEPIPQCT